MRAKSPFRLALLLLPALLLGPAAARAGTDGFAYAFTAIEGGPLPLADYRGKAVLVANTASFCGFTPQYEDLQAVYDRYRDRGLVVLGVPSDDFNQESDDDAAIKTFCEVNYKITFPLTERVHVEGPQSHPLFAHFREALGEKAGPGWNFYKYLIAPDGRVVASRPSSVKPTSAEITGAIERALPGAS
ncbi:MAG: glutathione peroxidase [Geminicoccaceae bacterium]|nr:glutathione peroxidase [Geminicoccaceae bacterium]